MRRILSGKDLAFILESLSWTRKAFENTTYPSYEFRVSRLGEVNDVMTKVRDIYNHRREVEARRGRDE